jgi:hypothetical protein
MTAGVVHLTLQGEIVERQTFLNGTAYYLLEGEGDAGRAWTLAVTLPKAEGQPVVEGDFTLYDSDDEWSAGLENGSHRFSRDEDDDEVLVLTLRLLRRAEPEIGQWQAAALQLTVLGSTVGGELALER